MAILMGDLRAALVEAGASDAVATKAATEVATYENRLAKIETDKSVLKWMVGANIAMTTGVLFKLFH